MHASLREAGLNAAISILDGDVEYTPEDLNVILEFALRVGNRNLDTETQQLLGSSISRTCYRNEEYALPLYIKGSILQLPDI